MKVKYKILRESFNYLLAEGRVEDARQKFQEIEDDIFNYLVRNQPAGSNNKYLLWSCNQVEEGHSGENVIQTVRLFDGSVQRLKEKDINKYKDINAVEEAIAELNKNKKGLTKAQKRADSDLVYQDERFLVIRPFTTETSQKYGAGTKWCISATASRNYFEQYSQSNNKFYFLIDRTAQSNTPESKFAYAIIDPKFAGSNAIQIYNASDHLVKQNVVTNIVGAETWSKIWEKITAHVKAHPDTREIEELKKETDVLAKEFIEGKELSKEAVRKIAKGAKLTQEIVENLLKYCTNNKDNRNVMYDIYYIVNDISERINTTDRNTSIIFINWGLSLALEKGMHSSYSCSASFKHAMEIAPLTEQDCNDLYETISNPKVSKTLSSFGVSLFKNNATSEELKSKILSGDLGNSKWEIHDLFAYLVRQNKISPNMYKDAIENERISRNLALDQSYYEDALEFVSAEILSMCEIKDMNDLSRLLKFRNAPQDLVQDSLVKLYPKLNHEERTMATNKIQLTNSSIEKLWNEFGDQNTRVTLLQNKGMDVNVLAKFASSKNSAYRFAVANNENAPEEALEKLANDPSVSTRAAVASSTKSKALLTKLAKDDANIVRTNVAANKLTTPQVLQALTKDSDEYTRKMARRTIKSLTQVENMMNHITKLIIKEELNLKDDEELEDIMTPLAKELPHGYSPEIFVCVYLLQHNGHASREDIQQAYVEWTGTTTRTKYVRRGYRRVAVQVPAKTIWNIIQKDDRDLNRWNRSDDMSHKISVGINQYQGLFWAAPGVRKGAIYRLTARGAQTAMKTLKHLKEKYPDRVWTKENMPPAKTSPAPKELDPNYVKSRSARTTPNVQRTNRDADAPKVSKTTYKIYGRKAGRPVHTRLKGKAYIPPPELDTAFLSGDNAELTPDNGKLKVKKPGGDHTQTWDPTEG